MNKAVCSIVAALCVGWPGDARAADLPGIIAAIRPQLSASAVPVLLPDHLPPAVGRIRSVAVISAGRSGYYVAFSSVSHCAGALSCAFFHVAGFPLSHASEQRDSHDRIVRLFDGTRAMFRPSDCSGASCTEATLTFERYGASYELDAKVSPDNLGVLETVYERLRRVAEARHTQR